MVLKFRVNMFGVKGAGNLDKFRRTIGFVEQGGGGFVLHLDKSFGDAVVRVILNVMFPDGITSRFIGG